MKTGQCKFGQTCKFHHPVGAGIQVPSPPPAQVSPVPAPAPALYPALQSPSVAPSQQYGVVVARPPLIPGSYLPGAYSTVLLSPGMVPFSGWGPYPVGENQLYLLWYFQSYILFRSLSLILNLSVKAPVSPVASPGTQPAVGSSSIYGVAPLSTSGTAYTGSYQSLPSSLGPSSTSQKEHLFPERPGQPECQYYMKTGDCKFGSSCRYHHPPELVAPKTTPILSPMGLPLRPVSISLTTLSFLCIISGNWF